VQLDFWPLSHGAIAKALPGKHHPENALVLSTDPARHNRDTNGAAPGLNAQVLKVEAPSAPSPSSQDELRIRASLVSPRDPLPPRQRKFKTGTTGFMLAMHVGAVFALLPRFWSWQAVVVLAVLYWTTVLGVTLGLHRLVTHRSFEAPRWLERLLVLMGALACQSGPIEWVGLHRHHHKYSDQPNDHHDAGRGLDAA
jgi:stearoyl-CoA desaturase (delta-9 desaturase)